MTGSSSAPGTSTGREPGWSSGSVRRACHTSEDLDKLITASTLLEPVAIPVSALASAQVRSRGSLSKPPQARLMFTDGRHFDVGILWSPTTWNPSPKNRVAFDDFLSKLPVPVS